MKFAFTVDLEDWYHGIELPYDSWKNYEHRLDVGLDKILQLLADNNTKATFFTLGWIADRYPNVVKKVFNEGHELASHGYSHEKVYDLSHQEFREEVVNTKSKIEEITGTEIHAYRAPFFSVTSKSLWALEILAEAGYSIDCSISPVKTWRYGISTCPQDIFKLKDLDLVEFPVSTFTFLKKKLGIGGAYFRLFPYALSNRELKKLKDKDQHTMFYIHPWEYDPDHPKIKMERKAQFTHYVNLKKTYRNTELMIRKYNFGTVSEVVADFKSSKRLKEVSLDILQD